MAALSVAWLALVGWSAAVGGRRCGISVRVLPRAEGVGYVDFV